MPPAKKKAARTSAGKASVKQAPTAKKRAEKKPAKKKPAPAKKPPAKMSPESVLQWSKGSPSTPMDLRDFESDDEEGLMDEGVGYAFLRELQERGHDVNCGFQVSKAVFNVVVGKPGGTVLISAGVSLDSKKDKIVVGQKGKPITPKDFELACAKMGKIKGEDKTYVLPTVVIWPPALIDVPGISWAVEISYDS